MQNRLWNNRLKTLIYAVVGSLGLALLVFSFTSGYITRNAPRMDSPENMQISTLMSAGTNQAGQTTEKVNIVTGNVNVETVAQSVARTATESVVGITLEIPDTGSLFDSNSGTQVGVGSGFIVDQNGYILTNNHVAGDKGSKLVVTLSDGRNVDGITVWTDPVLDLAVVKVELTGLPVLTLGDATTLSVGEPAIAIGNPLGLEFQSTVTSGIISAVNRTIRVDTDQGANYMEGLIQTDASINPGNSGGPLLNSKGEVVGINTIKVSSAEAMGFAIPINAAKPIIDKLADGGTFKEAYLGVFAFDRSLLKYINGFSETKENSDGVYVAYIDETSPAYKAGIRKECIIKSIDGTEVNTMLQMRTIILSKTPGDIVDITHMMHGEDTWITVPVELAEKVNNGSVTR